MKKSLIILMITTFFLFGQSQQTEANPALAVAGAVALGALLVTGSAVNYYKPLSPPSPNQSGITSSGAIGYVALAAYHKVSEYGTSVMYSKYVTLKAATLSAIQSIVQPDDSPYPFLRGVLCNTPLSLGSSSSSEFIDYGNSKINFNGTTFSTGSKVYDNVTRYSWSEGMSPITRVESGYLMNQYSTYVSQNTYDVTTRRWAITSPVVSGTTPLAKPIEEAIPAYNDVKNNTQATDELAELISANPSLFTAVDTANPDDDLSTAPPFVPPADVVATPGVSTPPASVTAGHAVTTTGIKLTEAQKALQDYQNAHPTATRETDPVLKGLQDAVSSAQVSVASAQVAADSVASQESFETLPDAVGVYDTSIDLPELKNIKTLLLQWMANNPLAAIIRSFTVTTNDGVCSFITHLDWLNKDIEFDFCKWSSWITTLGGVLLIFSHGLAVFIIFGRD